MRRLYLTGESYCGHYLPAFGKALIEDGSFNLAGVAIGDGLTDALTQVFAYSNVALANGFIDYSTKKQIDYIQTSAYEAIIKGDPEGDNLFGEIAGTVA